MKAPLGLSKTFCAATSMLGARCSRVRRRYSDGGAMTTSVLGSGTPNVREASLEAKRGERLCT